MLTAFKISVCTYGAYLDVGTWFILISNHCLVIIELLLRILILLHLFHQCIAFLYYVLWLDLLTLCNLIAIIYALFAVIRIEVEVGQAAQIMWVAILWILLHFYSINFILNTLEAWPWIIVIKLEWVRRQAVNQSIIINFVFNLHLE